MVSEGTSSSESFVQEELEEAPAEPTEPTETEEPEDPALSEFDEPVRVRELG